MDSNLLMLAQEAAAADWFAGSALPEALRISGIGMVAIFFVMGLFGSMIALLARVFPESTEESE